MQIRIVPPPESKSSPKQELNPLLISPDLEDLVKDGRMVSMEQYKAIASDQNSRQMLEQQDMQQVLRVIDSSSSREAELSTALRNPQFSAFCERVLDHVSPQV